MSCPLYDRLYDKVYKKDLRAFSIKDSTHICEQINLLPRQAVDLTYVLIRIHSLRSGDCKYFEHPYGSTIEPTDDNIDLNHFSFFLHSLPILLQYILQQFVIVNKEAIEEEQQSRKLSPKGKRSKSPDQAVKSFMKKNVNPSFTLRNIDSSSLDKLYSMQDIIDSGERTLINPLVSEENLTTIESLGICSVEIPKFITVILKKDSEKTESNCYCHYCKLLIPDSWSPIHINNNSFCSFNCILAFSPTLSKIDKNNKDIYHIYKKYKKDNRKIDIINPSPPFILLEEYGGWMDAKEYQKYIYQNMVVHNIEQSIRKEIL